MKPKTTLSISITYRRPEEIKEVEELSKEAVKSFKQAGVYLMGLRQAAEMLRKAKSLVK